LADRGHGHGCARRNFLSARAAALPVSVRGVMENLIVGQTLDADAERQARSQGWRVR
jgi:hypothetical protein